MSTLVRSEEVTWTTSGHLEKLKTTGHIQYMPRASVRDKVLAGAKLDAKEREVIGELYIAQEAPQLAACKTAVLAFVPDLEALIAEVMDEWKICRLAGKPLHDFAARMQP